MKKTVVLLSLILGFTLSASAQGLAIGSKMDNFALSDTSGQTRSLNSLKGKNGAVVIFLSAQCAVVKGYNERISQVADDYKAKGINFIGIRFLQQLNDNLGGPAIFVLDTRGRVLASSNWIFSDNLLGVDLAYMPFFQAAVRGTPARHYAIDPGSPRARLLLRAADS